MRLERTCSRDCHVLLELLLPASLAPTAILDTPPCIRQMSLLVELPSSERFIAADVTPHMPDR